MATRTTGTTSRQRATKGRANRGTKRNPARGVVDLREKGRPNARNPYYATWYDAVTKRKGGSKSFSNLPDAVQWIADQEAANMAAYYRGEPARVKSVAFGDVAESWAKTLTKSHNTVNGYRVHARQLVAFFGYDRPVSAIEKHDVQAMLHDALKVKGLAEGTVKVRINVLNQIMESAVDRKLRPGNPCRGVDRPRDRDRAAHIFTEAEVAAVLSHLHERFHGPVLLAYYGGLRIGEALGMTRRALDLDTGRVRIGRVRHSDRTEQDYTKSGKSTERADLPEYVLPTLRALVAEYPPLPDGTLFSHRDSHGIVRPISQNTMRNHFKKACAAAGLPVDEIRFHDLRHSCATNYARADAPAHVIQGMLRHARMDTSQRYIDQMGDDQRRRWANRVGGALTWPSAEPDAA